ncbi:MAG TPA: hypothetical protein VG755_35740, partial [Nannocystaceae bacterium]|nr:hypothetical protein [Nannocystaceae bacterium]
MRPHARLLALSLLCPTALACATDDLAALDESSSSGEGFDALPDDVALDPPTSETRDLHRSRLALGWLHSCAVISNGTVRCWGTNDAGELGDGTTTDRPAPTAVAGLTDVVAIDAGEGWTVALRSNGTVHRWGRRWGAAGLPEDWTPQQVPGLSDIVAIGVDFRRACAVHADGRLFCWGSGSLGDAAGTNASSTPVQVSGITTAIATSGSCTLLANGTIKCWGGNSYGQLGNGTEISSDTPVTVLGIGNAVSIASATYASYAVLADGTVHSWGRNYVGELGIGDTEPSYSSTPVEVIGIDDARTVVAGHEGFSDLQFACAALADGTARCWGTNIAGALGIGVSDTDPHPTPVEVMGVDGVVGIAAEGKSACAARADGSVTCWGYQSGSTPTDVVGLAGVSDDPRVATGMYHGCGLRSDGTVKCWGDNSEGQIGDGTQIDRSSATLVGGLSNVTDVAAGGRHSCALLDDTSVRC